MRTTVAIPDDLYREVRPFVKGRSFSQFVREAVRSHLTRLRQESLEREMDEGYRAEAKSPSLDSEWTDVEKRSLPGKEG